MIERTIKVGFGIALLLCGMVTPVSAQPSVELTPRSADPRVHISAFAGAPDIVQPVGCAMDAKGRLLVIESHTHFRPQDYKGPKHDRIRILEDSDGDGKADRFGVYFEGLVAAMGIAVDAAGSVFVATRNQVLQLRDADGDGAADESKQILRLETTADYPHNGLSGLAFANNGDLLVGMGENMGGEYRLVAADGASLKGGGEGGNIYRCSRDGRKLQRIATGFWNPFGICLDGRGNIFAVDNDPDATPPCRMLHVVQGGDYGYQYRYGRQGKHPFQSWNGELAGTLPQMTGTGEAPCQILQYQGENLPEDYLGDLLVASWADHRIERYRVKPRGISFSAERLPFITSNGDFRPVGIAVAPDGSLYVTDWVSKDYHLHGRGAVWHIAATNRPAKRLLTPKPAMATNAPAPLPTQFDRATLMAQLGDADPFVRCEAVRQLSLQTDLMRTVRAAWPEQTLQRIGLLLACRASGRPDGRQLIPKFLTDADPEVRFLAVKWIADEKLVEFRPQLVVALRDAAQNVRMAMGLATALARVEGREAREAEMADYFYASFSDAKASAASRAAALKLIPASFHKLRFNQLFGFAPQDAALHLEAVRLANESPNNALAAAVIGAALEGAVLPHIRAEAVVGLQRWASVEELVALTSDAAAPVRDEALRCLLGRPLSSKQRTQIDRLAKRSDDCGALAARLLGRPFHSRRPSSTDLDAWLRLLEGAADVDAGRRIFTNPKPVGCARCHRMDGRGQNIGPDLGAIGRSERRAILESLLQPSNKIAPSYQSMQIATTDGRTRVGMLVHTTYDECTYVDAGGERFTVVAKDVERSTPSAKSIMPDGLLEQLTDQEARDLLAYLCSHR